jgi:hypothetical protein
LEEHIDPVNRGAGVGATGFVADDPEERR